jgi:Glycosyltransferase Family 4
VTIRRVLGLGTYPIVKPVNGGQRRVDAIRKFYHSIGIDYVYACIYNSVPYGPPLVGPHDIPLAATAGEFGPVALTGDLLSGLQAETDASTLAHFVQVLERTEPDAIQLEQPFMWPLAKRLRDHLGGRVPIIYSSHNVEAPLKQAILVSAGATPDLCHRVCGLIERIEAELCQNAALIVCVSASEREHYLKYKPSAVTIVPNGVDRPPAAIASGDTVRKIFGDNRFLFMVGSAYLPNIEGFCDQVARDGMFFSPPLKSVAVCGGVADGIRVHPAFQRFAAANSARVHFFPTIDDDELWAIKDACHAVMLPILTGGGSNLKAAEALTLGKWVIATPMALRGFESFMDAEGVILAKDRHAFRRALAQTLKKPVLQISNASRKAREGLYWDALFTDSSLAQQLSQL